MASPSASTDPLSSPSYPRNGLPVIIILFVSVGCIFFSVLCLCFLWFLIKRRKKEEVQETDVIRADEHFKVKEDIVNGPHGQQAVVLSFEDDKHFQENVMKNEKQVEGTLMQAKNEEISTTDLESGGSSSTPNAHHTSHHVESKP